MVFLISFTFVKKIKAIADQSHLIMDIAKGEAKFTSSM